MGRLFHKLQDVDYELVYVPGEKNFLPDFLSRSFETESNVCLLNQTELKSTIDWKAEQSRDNELCELKKLYLIVYLNYYIIFTLTQPIPPGGG